MQTYYLTLILPVFQMWHYKNGTMIIFLTGIEYWQGKLILKELVDITLLMFVLQRDQYWLIGYRQNSDLDGWIEQLDNYLCTFLLGTLQMNTN